MGYRFGEIAGFIFAALVIIVLLQFVDGLVRKLLRKPRKSPRDWLRGWTAGPEIFAVGLGYEAAYAGQPLDETFLFVAALEYLGLAMLIIKTVAYVVSRLRRRPQVVTDGPQPAQYRKHVSKSADEPETI
jgi:hypothetical protein